MSEQQVEMPIPEMPAVETAAPAVPAGRDWQGWLVFVCGAGAMLWGLFGALGSGWGLWDWTTGFAGLKWSSLLAAAGLVLGIFFS